MPPCLQDSGPCLYFLHMSVVSADVPLLAAFYLSAGWVPPQVDQQATDQTQQIIVGEREHTPTAEQAKAIRALPLFLMVSLSLVLVVLVGSFVLVRALRRYRQ